MYYVFDVGWGSIEIRNNSTYDIKEEIFIGKHKTRRDALINACDYIKSLLQECEPESNELVDIRYFYIGINDVGFKERGIVDE